MASGKDVYNSLVAKWRSGELEVKNELILTTEKLIFWRRFDEKYN
jgi:hypothetical protein